MIYAMVAVLSFAAGVLVARAFMLWQLWRMYQEQIALERRRVKLTPEEMAAKIRSIPTGDAGGVDVELVLLLTATGVAIVTGLVIAGIEWGWL